MPVESKTAPQATSPAAPLTGLEGELVRIESKRRLLKKTVQELRTERDNLKTELDTLRSKPADPTAVQLRAELREFKHRKVFDRLATDAKARPEALDDLWKLTGYVPEADDADETTIKGLIDQQAKTRSYLFDGEALAAEKQPIKATEKQPGPGSTRGNLARDSGKFQVRRKGIGSVRDGAWMQLNQRAYAEALKAGNVEYID